LLLVANHARQLRKFNLHQSKDDSDTVDTLCHPLSKSLSSIDHKSVIARRALLHQRICLLQMIQNNPKTLKYASCDSKSITKDTLIKLRGCHQLKSLHINNGYWSGPILKELCGLFGSSHHLQRDGPLEELEIPLTMLYSKKDGSVGDKLRPLLSLRRLVLSSDYSSPGISPRTFDNIIANLTGLTSLTVPLGETSSFDASAALAQLVNLQKLEVDTAADKHKYINHIIYLSQFDDLVQ
jgi:hypothetical protein